MATPTAYTGKIPVIQQTAPVNKYVIVFPTDIPYTVPPTGPPFLRVVISGAPVWPSFVFANGTVGVSFNQSWDLAPALSPTTYTLVSGSLPTGLSLSNVSGDIGQVTGTPTAAGSYSFTLRATNSLGTSDKSFTMTVGTAVSGGAFTFVN